MGPGKVQLQKTVQRYKAFHGKPPKKFSSFELTIPRSVTYLGNACAIEYESTKALRGTHKLRLYRHKIGPGCKIYLHPDGKTLIIRGGKFRVTDWMRG